MEKIFEKNLTTSCIGIGKSTPADIMVKLYVPQLGSSYMQAGNDFPDRGTLVKNSIKHGNQMVLTVELLTVIVRFMFAGQLYKKKIRN